MCPNQGHSFQTTIFFFYSIKVIEKKCSEQFYKLKDTTKKQLSITSSHKQQINIRLIFKIINQLVIIGTSRRVTQKIKLIEINR